MVSAHFSVEVDSKVVGLAVRVKGGFRFFAGDPALRQLEQSLFPRVKAIVERVRELRGRIVR
jgi:hypothetical protein